MRTRHLHRRFIGLQNNQRITLGNSVTNRYTELDYFDITVSADVWNQHLDFIRTFIS